MFTNKTYEPVNLTLKKFTCGTMVAVMLVCFFMIAPSAQAQGDLLVMPKRVVFEGNKRFEDLNLANTGKDSATYVISFVQVRMKQDGSFENITEPDSAQLFADKYLRYFPRTVTLGPNEAQTVKVQITKKGEIPPGEYRSHLYFRAIPNERPLGDIDPNPKQDSMISVVLRPIFGISIPVIIRVGDGASNVSLTDFEFKYFKDTVPTLKMKFNRSGNISSYGDIAVDHIEDNGTITRVGVVKGLAVYTPNTVRNFMMELYKIPGVNYHRGKLKVTYSDQSPKALVIAAGELDLKKDNMVAKESL
jgi:hypothetical protein